MQQVFSEHQAEVGDVRLNYAVGGQGPPLLLIPGQSLGWQSYLRVLPRLARRFRVFAIDIRGHGRSSWTTGRYSFSAIGGDLERFLREVIGAPAIVSGNSSGGVLAVYLAAKQPALVRAILPEDPPLFLSEWPRLSGTFAHKIFVNATRTLLGPQGRDLAAFFDDFEVPLQGRTRVMRFPKVLGRLVARSARRARARNRPLNLWWAPFQVRVFVRGLSEYDPDFSRAFADGSACDIDHAALLSAVRCPMWLLHASWFEHPTLGTVGAMRADEAARAHSLVAGSRLITLSSGHILHQERPREFARLVAELADSLA